jgi:hypothetical protein
MYHIYWPTTPVAKNIKFIRVDDLYILLPPLPSKNSNEMPRFGSTVTSPFFGSPRSRTYALAHLSLTPSIKHD